MPDDSRFRKQKSIWKQFLEIASIVSDVVFCMAIFVPVMLRVIFSMIYCSRKSVAGKLALVKIEEKKLL
jgi:hypothetical protein